jgi:hypothetical protein
VDATGFVRWRRRLVTSTILASAAAGILGRMRVIILLVAVILGVPASQSAVERTLVISVVDETGAPVMDVTPADMRVREDGIDGDVVSVRRASGPLFVQLLIDTTPGIEPYVSDIRKALVGFVQHVKHGDPAAELGLMEFGQAAVPIVPITADASALEKGIRTLFPKPRSASVLLEGIFTASRSLASKSTRRRAIVSFNVEPSDEQSRQAPGSMMRALASSGTQVWSLSLQTGNRNNASRDVVLDEVAKRSGGQREIIVTSSAIDQYLRRYANALLTQYELTYRVVNPRRPQVVQTGTTRPGTKVHASTFPPL